MSLYARHFHKSPARLGADDIRAYQLDLVHDQHVSWSRFTQRVCALRLLSRITLGKDWAITHLPFPRQAHQLPVVLSAAEVAQFLGAITNRTYHMALSTAYAAGLRVSDVRHWHVSDIDSQRLTIRIRQGKGQQDRSVMRSPTRLTLRRQYGKAVRPTECLFPGKSPQQPIGARTLQDVCWRACRDAGLGQRVTAHTLRHSLATPLLEAGTAIRTIQRLRGHNSLRPTALYTQVAATTVAATVSPFDALPLPPQSWGTPMAAPLLEVADICRQSGPAYRDTHDASLAPQPHRAMHTIELCRPAALGGHVAQCDACGHQAISDTSCRHRHCPTCQALAKAQWWEARRAERWPVESCHVVFTLPGVLAPLALPHQKVVYNLRFRAAAGTWLRIAADPQHLGARIGFLAILHTGGHTLLHHPHLHGVVPAGGLSPAGQRWISCRKGFLRPVGVLSRLFRRRFLEGLQAAFAQRQWQLHGQLQSLAEPHAVAQLLARCPHTEWVVYATPPFGGPAQVLEASRPWHAPRRHLQSSLTPLQRRARVFPLEGWSPPQPTAGHDARCHRVHPPLPAAYPARGLRAPPLLRWAQSPPARRNPGALPAVARSTRAHSSSRVTASALDGPLPAIDR